ncbi:MAG: ribose 5-phosphate isomerase B [Anaerolineaceae bacterium]|nr:ribose 5-phosphate isomerase B [Anaerolineaceae bacterium]
MHVAVASDHAGFLLKKVVLEAVQKAGHEAIDLGTNSPDRVDYPDFAEKACRVILAGKAERGILICGSGVGVCIAANKMKGIYASVCHDTYSAHQGVEHDKMNVLCLGGLIIGAELATELVNTFLSAQFSGIDRFQKRIDKVHALEDKG